MNYIVLAKRMGLLIDVEQAIVNCMSSDKDDPQMRLLLVCTMYLKKRTSDAIYFMNNIIAKVGIKNTSCSFNMILAFLYKESNNDLLCRKHLETAKRFKMRELGLLPPVGSKSKKLDLIIRNEKQRKTTISK